ncbi:hypothetical protein TL5118_04181 [Thalassovita autumnalis]|jgi:hypothetical protein|uniref:Uncharacterized protein n=1 Tax=Thalassovita autumnalis TaxID=2072972 RepID=A0A0P1FT91_9RHOB|nr:hypothetical protein TL5118_04181 [Thalassovita autumnalis]CUH71864.1 hypothetical protein TL5120_01656 [Thalassovita autumnalis]
MEVVILLWIVCAGLSYMVARDRAPSKTGLAAALGLTIQPLPSFSPIRKPRLRPWRSPVAAPRKKVACAMPRLWMTRATV